MVKGVGRVIIFLWCSIYDIWRYLYGGAWFFGIKSSSVRSFEQSKIGHAIEKSLSFSRRNPNSGWANVRLLIKTLIYARDQGNITRADREALFLVQKFIEADLFKDHENAQIIRNDCENLFEPAEAECGSEILSSNELARGVLKEPEKFFFSRRSIREYNNKNVRDADIKRAVELALRTPSACNRQPWKVYYTSEKAKKLSILKHQAGNAGFGEEIPTLVLITADRAAFGSPQERNQHWIDGGMFSANLVLAFHSLGLLSCCLNWAVKPNTDWRLRRLLDLPKCEDIIMMISVGYPNEENISCVSPRKEIQHYLTKL